MLSDARNANSVTKTSAMTTIVTTVEKSDMAVNMLHNLKDNGFHVKKLVMDNDATIISKARSNFDPNIKKPHQKELYQQTLSAEER